MNIFIGEIRLGLSVLPYVWCRKLVWRGVESRRLSNYSHFSNNVSSLEMLPARANSVREVRLDLCESSTPAR